ncbi:MAG: radical SAM protein [Candidatus Sumerlaeia bacterium]|nr:radical SAM protein [Candidatus Sumerlaeia bacterium]
MCATAVSESHAAEVPAYLVIEGEPAVPMLGLETVWFQITGTLCNLTCSHCFVESSPRNHTHEFMTLDQVRHSIAEAVREGVRDFGFTGGEPFIHPQIIDVLALALEAAPALVLSNGTLFTAKMARRLRALVDQAPHPLDIRVSLDGDTAAQHDAVRGEGAFDRAIQGLRQLIAAGLAPSVATTATWQGVSACEIERRMRTLMASLGAPGAAVRIFPPILIGAEAKRLRPYRATERLTPKCVERADPRKLMCSNSRLITERGTWVCTLLANVEEARMGDSLAESLRPHRLTHGACYTCFTQGVTCTQDR